MRKNPVEFMEDYCEFAEDRVYILMGIARKRYNPDLTHNTEIVYRKVIKNGKDIERKYDELVGMIEGKDYNFYIYLSANARNVYKAFFNYQNRMNNWVKQLVNGSEDIKRKFKQVDKNWMSELQRPPSRDDEYFLFDVDNKDIVDRVQNQLSRNTKVKARQETRNGYHLVTEPYNYNEDVLSDEEDVERKTDALLYINFIGD